MEKFIYETALFDFYGALLTEKQHRCLQLHLYNDFTVSEIAEQVGVSRQGAYDAIRHAEKTMQSCEEKLGLVKRYQKERQQLKTIYRDMIDLKRSINDARINDILDHMDTLLGQRRETMT